MRVLRFGMLTASLVCALGISVHASAQTATTGPAARPPAAQDGSDANSKRAQEVEKLALRILEMPTVKDAVAKGLKDLRESDMAGKPDGIRYAKSAIDETAMNAAFYAAMGNAPEPVFIWVAATPRKWNGYSLPGSRWFGDNVDTFYRAARVDEQSSYEITLRWGKTLPAQLSFLVYDYLMYELGTGTTGNELPLASIEITDATPRNPDGTITLQAGPGPANGRPNYLQLKAGSKQLFVREIRGDGSLPAVRLSIKRTGGEAPKPKSMDDLAQEAALYIASGVVATNNVTKVFGELSENQLGPIQVRWAAGGTHDNKMVTDEVLTPERAVGFISSGLFNLKEDEALVLTLNLMGTRYVSINTYRPFIVSPEHVYGSSGLNNFQTKANPDGSISFVLSRKDPGVSNWLDVGGIPFGYIAVRWQTLTRPVSATLKNAVESVKLVKLSDLRKELPQTTKWVTPEERAEQRATRAKQFMLRCLGTPCEVGGALDKPY